jgi:predicted porin
MSRRAGLQVIIAFSASVALTAFSAASADDPGSHLKDPLPDSFTLAGVTLYGTIDVGYAYQSEGVPLNSKLVGGLEYQAFTTTRNFAGSQATLAESGIEQSKIGVRVEEPIGNGFNLVGRVETGFNPLSGDLTDACASIAENSGVKQGQQTANADSSRCGQALNGPAFGGVSNKAYGTLTIGRQQSLQLDALAVYDPQTLSYAFSFLGYSGFDGGAGSTEGARWDNSAKYNYQNNLFHVVLEYSNGGRDTGVLGDAFGAQAGITIQGLSVDAVYQKENGAVNLRSAFDDVATPLPTPGLAAYISSDTSYNIMGKYVFNLSGGGTGADGKPMPADKLTLYAGYSHIEKAHSPYATGFAQGEYPLSIGININQSAEYSLEWLGAKYALHSGWNFTGAFYHANQNSWTIGLGAGGTENIGCSGAGLLCAGDFYEGSFAVDYIINKHYDAYIGVNYSEVTDGLANGFVGTTANGNAGSESQTTGMVGFRIKF